MTTWIDTNVLVSIWSGDVETRSAVQKILGEDAGEGKVVLSGCVYAEFIAGPHRTHQSVMQFLRDAEIAIAWHTGEDVWLLAGERYAEYAQRRRAHGSESKRFLADFLIGAQATVRGGRLITFDQRIYRAAFPELELFGSDFGEPPA